MSNVEPGKPLVISIDDDEVSNLISRMMIRDGWPDAEVVTFVNGTEGLAFLQGEFMSADRKNQVAIMLLNITMPVMSGWEFLRSYDRLNDMVKNRIKVYMLSSSIDYRDLEMSRNNRYVLDFLPKPLTTEMVLRLRSIRFTNFP